MQIYRVEGTYCADIQGGRYVLCRYTGWKVRTVQIYRVEGTYSTDVQSGRDANTVTIRRKSLDVVRTV